MRTSFASHKDKCQMEKTANTCSLIADFKGHLVCLGHPVSPCCMVGCSHGKFEFDLELLQRIVLDYVGQLVSLGARLLARSAFRLVDLQLLQNGLA